jgi:hypothetical protein
MEDGKLTKTSEAFTLKERKLRYLALFSPGEKVGVKNVT